MKLLSALVLTLSTVFFISPAAHAASLGDVILDGLRGEIRDSIGDSVRRSVCQPPEEQPSEGQNNEGQNGSNDFCEGWQDIDELGDALRRGSNAIRAIDAIFD